MADRNAEKAVAENAAQAVAEEKPQADPAVKPDDTFLIPDSPVVTEEEEAAMGEYFRNEEEEEEDIPADPLSTERRNQAIEYQRREAARLQAKKVKDESIRAFIALKTAQERKLFIWGKVTGVTTYGVKDEKSGVVVDHYAPIVITADKCFKVVIPLEEMYDTPPVDASRYDFSKADDRTSFSIQQRNFANGFINAEVAFIITRIEGDDENCSIEGSCRQADELRRRINYDGRRSRIREGDIIDATVLYATPNVLFTNIGGVRVRIFRSYITFNYIPMVYNYYHPGDPIRVMINKINRDAAGHVVSVEARGTDAELVDAVRHHAKLKRNDTYHAVLSNISRNRNGNYQAIGMIKDCPIPIRITNFSGRNFGEPPEVGDEVMVTFISIEPRSLFATCHYRGNIDSEAYLRNFIR